MIMLWIIFGRWPVRLSAVEWTSLKIPLGAWIIPVIEEANGKEPPSGRVQGRQIVAINKKNISQPDRKTNEYITEKMNEQDTILDETTRKQLIWYGHVDGMDPMWLPKIMINWKRERRKKWGRPRRTWKDGIYTAMRERDLRMGEWNNRRQWNVEVGRRRQTF